MQRFAIASSLSVLLLRRAYVAAGNVKVTAGGQVMTASVMRKGVDPPSINMGKVANGVEKEVFWMRDPKTGNWIPETHFNDVDAAELRAKFLSKKL